MERFHIDMNRYARAKEMDGIPPQSREWSGWSRLTRPKKLLRRLLSLARILSFSCKKPFWDAWRPTVDKQNWVKQNIAHYCYAPTCIYIYIYVSSMRMILIMINFIHLSQNQATNTKIISYPKVRAQPPGSSSSRRRGASWKVSRSPFRHSVQASVQVWHLYDPDEWSQHHILNGYNGLKWIYKL